MSLKKLDDIFSRLDELSPKEAHDSLYQLKNVRNKNGGKTNV